TQDNGTVSLPTGKVLSAKHYEVGGVGTVPTVNGAGSVSIVGSGLFDRGTFDILANSTIGVAQLSLDGNSTLSIYTDATFDSTQVGTQAGTMTEWVDGSIRLQNNTVFSNYGTFTIRCNRTWGINNNQGTFNNYATVIKDSTGRTTVRSPYNMPVWSATTWGKSGEIRFMGSGDESGLFKVDAGATFTFWTGSYTLKGTLPLNLTGLGSIDVLLSAGFVVPLEEVVNSDAPVFFGGASTKLSGAGSFTSTNSLTWTSGTVRDLALFSVSGALSFET